jgi:two-component system, OmpR family, response regulator ChvI
MTTVALVATDHNVMTSVSVALEAEGYCILAYTERISALKGFQAAAPDLAIVDVKDPRLEGAEALRLARAKSNVPVIFLTSTKDVIEEASALALGADDVIRKPFSERLLVERVKAVLRRGSPKDAALPRNVSSKILECGPLRMDLERHTCTWKNRRVNLTATEFLILHALASRPGAVKTRHALMSVAYKDPLNGDERNIDSHIKRMRKKLIASDSQFDMVQALYSGGYLFKQT